MRLNDFQVTENFNLIELQCPCCHTVKAHPRLVRGLQTLRCALGRPIVLTSGYRCAPHNEKVGGVKNSLHRRGLAADAAVPFVLQADFCTAAAAAGFTKTIAYQGRGFVHLEISPE